MAKRRVEGLELVSASAMAAHVGVERSYLDTLVGQGVIEKRADGLYDQTASRLRYFAHLRSERRKSPKSEADIAFQKAETEMLAIKIARQRGELVPLAVYEEMIDLIGGTVLTALSGWPARIAGTDLVLRRRIEAAVRELRVEISTTASAMADAADKPPPEEQAPLAS